VNVKKSRRGHWEALGAAKQGRVEEELCMIPVPKSSLDTRVCS
jgi:hypothetical protein